MGQSTPVQGHTCAHRGLGVLNITSTKSLPTIIKLFGTTLPKNKGTSNRFCNERRRALKTLLAIFWSVSFVAMAEAQGPPYGQYSPMPYQRVGPPGTPQQKMPSEYAFRPDLSNPEYGNCLQLEKNWKALWHRYNQYYNQVQMMNPGHPQFGPTTRYLQGMKLELDAAWNTFRSNCIYFPRAGRDRR